MSFLLKRSLFRCKLAVKLRGCKLFGNLHPHKSISPSLGGLNIARSYLSLGYIEDYTTQLCGDYNKAWNKDPYLTTSMSWKISGRVFFSFGEEEVASHKGFDSQILNMIPQRYVFLLPYSWQFYEWYLFDGAEISPITSWYMVKCHIIYDMVLAPSQLVVLGFLNHPTVFWFHLNSPPGALLRRWCLCTTFGRSHGAPWGLLFSNKRRLSKTKGGKKKVQKASLIREKNYPD